MSNQLFYSDPDHPMNAVYEEMIKEPMFVNHSYDEIVWLIDNETKRRKEVEIITHIVVIPIVIAASIGLTKLLNLLQL